MKNYSSNTRKKNSLLLSFLVLIGVLLVGYFVGSYYLLHASDLHNRRIIKERTNWIESNKDKLMYVYEVVFPQAENCYDNTHNDNCEEETRGMIDNQLAKTLGYADGSIGRLPIFFIRLKDKNTIEKLYQDGQYKKDNVETKGEKMIVEMLQGKRNPFAYPQYNCCGGDDVVSEIPIFNLFLPVRRYLKDFPSEIEHIYLMHNGKNEIIGGLVYLYGD